MAPIDPMEQPDLIPHLFRKEFAKITALLCKVMGVEHLAAAEDIASDTFLAAVNTWTYRGIPPNPEAWLYTVARNKALNWLQREKKFQNITTQLQYSTEKNSLPEIEFSDQEIADSQLQMIFAICHPAISSSAQIALALRVLCGLGVTEIAHAFLTTPDTINKRLTRARERLRQESITLEMPAAKDLQARLENVLLTIYLLFNEGYYSERGGPIIRQECCFEAMRLCHLLLENKKTNLPPVNALMALICFHSSRLEARVTGNGESILYGDQDETLWNTELIARGTYYLHEAAQGNTLHKYHLEATIAYWHTVRQDTTKKWENILLLYDQLLALDHSPIAALNRTFALAKVKGNAIALEAALALNLPENRFYHMLLGELYSGLDDVAARMHFETALKMTNSAIEKEQIMKRMAPLSH